MDTQDEGRFDLLVPSLHPTIHPCCFRTASNPSAFLLFNRQLSLWYISAVRKLTTRLAEVARQVRNVGKRELKKCMKKAAPFPCITVEVPFSKALNPQLYVLQLTHWVAALFTVRQGYTDKEQAQSAKTSLNKWRLKISQLNVTPAAQPLPRVYNEKLWVHKELHAQLPTISCNSLSLFYSLF